MCRIPWLGSASSMAMAGHPFGRYLRSYLRMVLACFQSIKVAAKENWAR
jgi:hypothetical protein